MTGYYAARLSGERLRACYEIAPPSAQRYLADEVAHLLARIPSGATVLELGCGYGRVLAQIATVASRTVGIDTSLDSIRLGRRLLAGVPNVALVAMDAAALGFGPHRFDVVCCVQNGISAFHVDQLCLFESALSAARPGGLVLFSSYAEEFWEDRLDWFRIQAEHGLVGEIDETATCRGTIVCRDGFTATTVSPERFHELARDLGVECEVIAVAGSSLFCELEG